MERAEGSASVRLSTTPSDASIARLTLPLRTPGFNLIGGSVSGGRSAMIANEKAEIITPLHHAIIVRIVEAPVCGT